MELFISFCTWHCTFLLNFSIAFNLRHVFHQIIATTHSWALHKSVFQKWVTVAQNNGTITVFDNLLYREPVRCLPMLHCKLNKALFIGKVNGVATRMGIQSLRGTANCNDHGVPAPLPLEQIAGTLLVGWNKTWHTHTFYKRTVGAHALNSKYLKDLCVVFTKKKCVHLCGGFIRVQNHLHKLNFGK